MRGNIEGGASPLGISVDPAQKDVRAVAHLQGESWGFVYKRGWWCRGLAGARGGAHRPGRSKTGGGRMEQQERTV